MRSEAPDRAIFMCTPSHHLNEICLSDILIQGVKGEVASGYSGTIIERSELAVREYTKHFDADFDASLSTYAETLAVDRSSLTSIAILNHTIALLTSQVEVFDRKLVLMR